MICPVCKAEYRLGIARCVDCDVDLVQDQGEAVRHPLAKKIALSEKYRTRLWSGRDPHFYTELLWSLWDKKVACYGAPENPPIPEVARGQQPVAMEPRGFEVWVSEENLPLAKWILDSATGEYEKEPPDGNGTSVTVTKEDVSPETAGICPLCFGEFTTASSYCPNCGVPLNSPGAEVGAEGSAWQLCNLPHPRFIIELRKALQAAGIPFNNANISSSDVFSSRYYRPNYAVLILKKDFDRATEGMLQVLQHWEFEPSAGFRVGRESFLDYWPVRAWKNGWLPEDVSTLVWSGENLGLLGGIGLALQEHEIPYRVDTGQLGTAKVFAHPADEMWAREIVREIVEGKPTE